MRRLLLILALSFAALVATAWPIALARGSEPALSSAPCCPVSKAEVPKVIDPLGSAAHTALWGTPRSALDRGESSDRRWRRLWEVAVTVSAAARGSGFSSPTVVAAALVALGQHESTWARYIGEDRCPEGPEGMRCDPDADGKPRALGYWQLHRTACPAAWSLAPSLDRLFIEAECAAQAFALAADRCYGKNPDGVIAGALAGYRGKCDASDGALRARTWATFHSVLEDGWPTPPLSGPGWARRPGKRTPAEGRRARELLTQDVGTWVELEPGKLGALVEWHFHDFGGEARPRGWHKGVSFFAPRSN